MRLWSLHPKYLDRKGLVALWREALLAQKVLLGETKGYQHHPQLDRFRTSPIPLASIATYLAYIYYEACRRDYHFNKEKIIHPLTPHQIAVTTGQIEVEQQHLLNKLAVRDERYYMHLKSASQLYTHPLFYAIDGEKAEWERVSIAVS